MSLIQKIAKRAPILSLAGGLAFLSGCYTTPTVYNTGQTAQHPGIEASFPQKLIDFVGDTITAPLRQNKTVVVNNYPQTQTPQGSITMVFVSNGPKDFDGNGIVECPKEYENAESERLPANKPIIATIFRFGNVSPYIAVRSTLYNLDDQKDIQTSNFDIVNSLKSYPLNCSPGRKYRLEMHDDKGNKVGEDTFEVVSTL